VNIALIVILALTAATTIAAFLVVTFTTAANAQTTTVTPEKVVNNTRVWVSEIQAIIDQSSYEDRTIGNLDLAQCWSKIAVIPLAGSANITAL
jgi:hypothetical protein